MDIAMSQTAKYGNFVQMLSVQTPSSGADLSVVRCGFGLVWCRFSVAGCEVFSQPPLV